MNEKKPKAERTRRAVNDEETSVGEKFATVASEAQHRAQAETDKTKRENRKGKT
jgi:hypothetical protein